MADPANGEPRYPVRVVISRTGLTADLLRAWERRYGAVRPKRSAGKQRLYSEDDVERLILLRRATLAGHSVGEIARLERSALEALVQEPSVARTGAPDELIDSVVAAALDAAENLDAAGVEAALRRGALAFGAGALIDQVISRFLRVVGERWHLGTLSPAHEHLASGAVRRVLAWTTDAYTPPPRAPKLIVATPTGESHEFGAMLTAAAAVEEGWQTVYLGPNLPAADLVNAAKQVKARAIALSVVYTSSVDMEVVYTTGRTLPRGVTLIVGGAAAESHREKLRDAGAVVVSDMTALRKTLRTLRASTRIDAHED
jgi:methanogenic corrinoid protein MtbC1